MYKYNSVASGTTKIVSAVLFPGLNPNCIHSASISYLKHAFHHLINFTILHNVLMLSLPETPAARKSHDLLCNLQK